MARRPFHQALEYVLASALALPLLSAPATAGRLGRDVGRGEQHFDARVAFNHAFRAAARPERTQALVLLAQTVPELAFEPHPTTGVVLTLHSHTGYLTGPDTGEPSAVGLAFVTENLASLGLDAEDLEHGPAESVVSPLTGSTRVYLQQRHAGLPVYEARLQINVNREGRIQSVNNTFLPGLKRAANTLSPRLGLAAAVRAARAFDATPAPANAQLALLPVRQDMARLVWNFQLPTADARYEHDLTVDAVTGKVWTRFERSRHEGRRLGGRAGARCFTNRQPRGVGAVWAQVLSNASARLAEDWGIAADPIDLAGGAGNERMALYVAEGVQNAGCTPTFTQMRDGILQAAADNHGGEDVCRLWEVFAAFGLGTNAVSGGPDSTSPTNGFDLPASCGGAAAALDASLADDEAALADPGTDYRQATLARTRRTVEPTAFLTAAQGGAGASLPYVELQAENAATNGTVIGPSFIYNQLACEASGRKAVTLAGQGRFVEFTLPSAANSIVVRYSIPDTASGSVYTASVVALHQRRQAAEPHPDQRLQLVLRRLPVHERPRQQSASLLRRGAPAPRRPWPPARSSGCRSTPRTRPRPTRSTSPTSSRWVRPRAQPANSVSVTSFGADPTGSADSTAALQLRRGAGRRTHRLDPERDLPRQRARDRQQRDGGGRGHVALGRHGPGHRLLRQLPADAEHERAPLATSRSAATCRSATTATRSTASAGPSRTRPCPTSGSSTRRSGPGWTGRSATSRSHGCGSATRPRTPSTSTTASRAPR